MATKKTNSGIPAYNLEQYNKLVDSIPGIERKGASMPYTSYNGNMFTFLSADGTMALRLGKEERDAFLKKHNTELMIAHGVVMKEYVKVPDELLPDTKTMKKYLSMSFDYVKTLKVKPTKK